MIERLRHCRRSFLRMLGIVPIGFAIGTAASASQPVDRSFTPADELTDLADAIARRAQEPPNPAFVGRWVDKRWEYDEDGKHGRLVDDRGEGTWLI